MEDKQIESLLLKLVEDMAVVKSKVEILDELKSEQKEVLSKVNKLDGEVVTHTEQIKKLEKRSDEVENYLRDEVEETNKSNKSVFISVGVCVVTAAINILFSLLIK